MTRNLFRFEAIRGKHQITHRHDAPNYDVQGPGFPR